jgi:hypothetical protein
MADSLSNSMENVFIILTRLYAIKSVALASEAQFAVSFLVVQKFL